MRKLFFLWILLAVTTVHGQDTLRVITYNLLHYGDGCQGSNSFLHSNLKTIVQYARPDILGMVKAQSIKMSVNDNAGISPVGFADSILTSGFNAAFPNTYDHCPVVNFSNDYDGDMDLLFFNKNKIGFLSVSNLCSYQEDFNLYKLYYKDANLAKTKDTTFLYFILNHTVSGDASPSRDYQDSIILRNLKLRFKHLPNLISMGDFNTHSSYERGYQLFTASVDSNFAFSDPPYWPDQKLSYPSSWQNDVGSFAKYLNTSTRATTLPNACGSDGGAKGWYLHTLLSPWVVNGKNYLKYVANSYVTLGNDGLRVGRSINDSLIKNYSVPSDVLNSLFQLSDKYPVMIELTVTSNNTGTSLPDPEINTVTAIESTNGNLYIENPVYNKLTIHFPPEFERLPAELAIYDLLGQVVLKNDFVVDLGIMNFEVDLKSGLYVASLSIDAKYYVSRLLKK